MTPVKGSIFQSLKWILPPITAFCPVRGMLLGSRFLFHIQTQRSGRALAAGGGRAGQSGRIKATLSFRAFSSLSLCLFSHGMIIPEGKQWGLHSGPNESGCRIWAGLWQREGGAICFISYPGAISSSHIPDFWGAWVAQSVKRLLLAQVIILGNPGIRPCF